MYAPKWLSVETSQMNLIPLTINQTREDLHIRGNGLSWKIAMSWWVSLFLCNSQNKEISDISNGETSSYVTISTKHLITTKTKFFLFYFNIHIVSRLCSAGSHQVVVTLLSPSQCLVLGKVMLSNQLLINNLKHLCFPSLLVNRWEVDSIPCHLSGNFRRGGILFFLRILAGQTELRLVNPYLNFRSLVPCCWSVYTSLDPFISIVSLDPFTQYL